LRTDGINSIGSMRRHSVPALVAALAVSILHPPAVIAGDGPVTLLIKGNLTTSSQLFIHPDSPDPVMRSESVGFTGFFGTGAEVRYRLPETSVAIGVSVDYIRAKTSTDIRAYPQTTVPVEDGYTVIPVEVTGYFIIPFSTETLGIYMGGGGGVYFGRRSYRIGTTSATLVESTPGAGIHVLGGVTYRFYDAFEAVFEMKFRDVQFNSTNVFAEPRVQYGSVIVNVDQKPFTSRTQTDGVVFQIGIGFTF
jgi:hypothetical protein